MILVFGRICCLSVVRLRLNEFAYSERGKERQRKRQRGEQWGWGYGARGIGACGAALLFLLLLFGLPASPSPLSLPRSGMLCTKVCNEKSVKFEK